MCQRPDLTQRLFSEVMKLFADGVLTPLPLQTFPAEDVVDAFRYMQQARHIGKIVVTYCKGLSCFEPQKPTKEQSLCLSADGTYLVTGGLGGFGLETARWLVDKGARHLVLVSRSGSGGEEARATIAEMAAKGVNVLARACDVTSREALKTLFSELSLVSPPLKGVVHAAVVIEDGLIRNLSEGQLERVLAAKMLGADYLDELTRNLSLDFFVLYSSATTFFGNPGQAAYVAANYYLESLARNRRAMGLPATCVCWGAIDDAGFLARNKKIKDALQSRMGGQAIRARNALGYLEKMLLNKQSGLGVLELDWRSLARFLPTAKTPRFVRVAPQFFGEERGGESNIDVAQMLLEFGDGALKEAFTSIVKEEVGRILRISQDKIDANASIYDMGLDSLMGVELVLALEERFGTKIPVMAISESPTAMKLAEKLIAQLRGSEGKDFSQDELEMQRKRLAAQHGVEAVITAPQLSPAQDAPTALSQGRLFK